MSDQLMAVIIGGTFGFIGAMLGTLISTWAENRKAKRDNLQAIRLRLVGDLVQTSEIMRFIESQRQRQWPYFWKKGFADLSQAHLEEIDFREKDLRNVIFYRAHLQGANFYRANLEGCDFTSADMSEADLFEANLRKARFFKTNLPRAKLDRVDLTGASLIACNLEGASLHIAQLDGADIRFANFKGASLAGADLREANIAEVNLSGASLEGTNFRKTIYNKNTVWPDGFKPEEAGAEFVEQAGSKREMAAVGRQVTNITVNN